MRLGIFGGTFDPVHYGHLLLAECCREECRLDEVWFLPTAMPPHKQRTLTPAAARIEMLELAIAGHAAFSVSRYETDRGGVNYTAETLAHFSRGSARQLFFLLGADMFHDLPQWREPQRICQLALPTVVRRWGEPALDFAPSPASRAGAAGGNAQPAGRDARRGPQFPRYPPPRGRRPEHPLPNAPGRGAVHPNPAAVSFRRLMA